MKKWLTLAVLIGGCGGNDDGADDSGVADAGGPDATVEPLPCDEVELLQNGDFDDGPDIAWLQTGGGPPIIVMASEAGAKADTPPFVGRFGSYNASAGEISEHVLSQPFAPGPSRLRLQFRYQVITEEPADKVRDSLIADVTGEHEGGSRIAVSNLDEEGTVVLDYNFLAVPSELYFRALVNDTNETTFLIDSVSLIACDFY